MKKINHIFESNGLSMGKALIYKNYEPKIKTKSALSLDDSLIKLEEISNKTINDLQILYNSLKTDHLEEAAILLTHIEMIKDRQVNEKINQYLENGFDLSYAIYESYQHFIDIFNLLEEEYMQQRSHDLHDVRLRLLKKLDGFQDIDFSHLTEDSVIIAYDLLPSQTAALDFNKVKGFITETGSMASHTIIIARSFNVPACVGITNALDIINENDLIILNSQKNEIIINPSQAEIQKFQKDLIEYQKYANIIKQYTAVQPITKDDVTIDLLVNLSNTRYSKDIYQYVDGVGLFRSEYLYLDKKNPPTIEEQVTIYCEILDYFKDKEVTIRTLDIGGDKNFDFMKVDNEYNPFLGLRGVRLALYYEDIFKTQIKALLMANKRKNLKVMIPMVTSLDDIIVTKNLIQICEKELEADNIAYNSFKFGIMIEVPSLIFILDQIIHYIDFASIGTNDLTQYLLAVDRTNANVVKYNQPYSPSVLRALYSIITLFNQYNKEISICGELAGDPKVTKILLGMGLRRFSMSISQVPFVKNQIVNTTIDEAQEQLKKIFKQNTEGEIKLLLNK